MSYGWHHICYVMYLCVTIVFICSGLSAAARRRSNISHVDKFDEKTWPNDFCQEGKLQSPINIEEEKVVEDYNRELIKYGRLKFMRYDNVLVTGVNDGREIKFFTEHVGKVLPSVSGGPLKVPYHLKKVSLHWLSEHSINGYKYPMEVHLIHTQGYLKISEALNKRHGLAVVSIFCNVTDPIDKSKRYEIEELMDYLPKLMKTGDRLKGLLVNFGSLLLPSSGSYYTYLGSLTEPDCNEVAVWIIFKDPIHIPADVYDQFTQAGEGRKNFRSLQNVYRHTVYEPPKSFAVAPAAVQMFVDAVNMFTDFFKNITSALKKGWDLH